MNFKSFPITSDRLLEKVAAVLHYHDTDFEGLIHEKYAFHISDRLNVIGWIMPNLKRRGAYLSGTIVRTNQGSKVEFSTKPNAVLTLFSLLAGILGCIALVLSVAFTAQTTLLAIFGIGLLLLSAFYYTMSIYLTNRLNRLFFKQLNQLITPPATA